MKVAIFGYTADKMISCDFEKVMLTDTGGTYMRFIIF